MSAGKGGEGAADLGAGGVAAGMQDARAANARLRGCGGVAAARSFARPIEVRAPLDELGDAQRAFGDQGLGGGAIDEAVAGVHGVFKVQGDVFVAFHGDGDAALRVVGVRFAQRLLGDDQDFAVAGEFDGGAKAGNACAHDEKIHLRALCHNL